MREAAIVITSPRSVTYRGGTVEALPIEDGGARAVQLWNSLSVTESEGLSGLEGFAFVVAWSRVATAGFP